jgi:NAD(P)-dependent dehydrogenase (short-subunit alcohol dehydrogenase family)
MAVRNSAKGEAAAAKLRQSHPKARIEVWLLDMSSYVSIQAFARLVQSQLSRIDIFILNAGVKNISFNLVKSTGHEEVFQVNYLSTMLLTLLLLLLLLPILKAKGPPGEPAHLTIVNAALIFAAAKSPNRDANPLFPSFNDPMTFSQENYNPSKLLAHMLLWNLVDYVNADDVIINLSDPAWVKGTELLSDAKGEM